MELRTASIVTPTQHVEQLKRRGCLQRLIGRFRSIQQIYTPIALTLLASYEAENPDSLRAEEIPLFLPSGIPFSQRQGTEMEGFVVMETEYRRAQMRSSLHGICNQLFVRTRLHTQRALHIQNQQASTRARQVLMQNERKLDQLKAKYCAAWQAAKELLQGEEHIGHCQLYDTDVRSLDDPDLHASRSARKTLGKQRRDAEETVEPRLIQPGESRQTLLWIWTGVDTSKDSEVMREATRVEWSKAWARKRQWDKELALLEEEMHRTLMSLRQESAQ